MIDEWTVDQYANEEVDLEVDWEVGELKPVN